MSGVTLCSRDPGLEQRLDQVLGPDTAFRRVWSDRWRDTVEATMDLCGADPEILIIGNDVHMGTTQALVVEAYRRFPRTAVVVLLPEDDRSKSVDLWRLGARDIVAINQTNEALASHLLGILEEVRFRREMTTSTSSKRSRVIVVLSPKGGTGKTTLAVNLSVAIARRHPNQTLLIDLDTQFGDCATGLGVEPQHSLMQALSTPHLKRSALKVFLTNHHSGLSLLSPPDDLMAADSINADNLKQTLAAFVEEFPYVVFDTSAGIDMASIAAMELATDFVFVTTTDVPATRAVRRQIEALDQIGFTKASRTLVINRSNAKVGLSVSDVEAAIGMQASFHVRSSRQIPTSTNQGIPIVESQSGAITKTFFALAEFLAPGGERA